MSIRTAREFEVLRAAGRIVALTLRELAARVRPGITTGELDEFGGRILKQHGARSAPALVYRFPGNVCFSVNEELLHGVPGGRVILAGDLVKLDLTAEKDGYMADAAVTVVVPPVREEAARLVACTKAAFRKGIAAARPAHRVCEIGMAVEAEVKRLGFSVVQQFCGHGIGRTLHEEPQVPNYGDTRSRDRLTEGLVITVEPVIAAGRGDAVVDRDGWTVRTADRSLAAHYEHTLVITRGEPILLTAA